METKESRESTRPYINIDSPKENHYEMLAIHTMEAGHGEYQQPRVVTNVTSAAVSTSVNAKQSTEHRRDDKKATTKYVLCVMMTLLFLFSLIAIAAAALSVLNHISNQTLVQNETREYILPSFDVNTTMNGVDQCLVKFLDQLSGDIDLLNSRLDNLSSLANETMALAHSERATLVSQIDSLQSRLNVTENELERARRTEQADHDRLQNQISTHRNVLGYRSGFTMHAPNCGPGYWKRVAHLDMSISSHRCPPVWREYRGSNGVRACGRPANAPDSSCTQNVYSTSASFGKICGRVIGYQVGSPDVFLDGEDRIGGAFVDGVSITYRYGPSRMHVWTYAAGLSDRIISRHERASCPCAQTDSQFKQNPPGFVGYRYYCESGNPHSTFTSTNTLSYTADPLWDGHRCEGTCCRDGISPPWFSVVLPHSISSNIEVRICGVEAASNEDTPISLLEIYVQ